MAIISSSKRSVVLLDISSSNFRPLARQFLDPPLPPIIPVVDPTSGGNIGPFFIFCVIIVVAILSCICCGVKRGRSKKLRRRYFKNNGGPLLKEELSNGTKTSTPIIFTEKQLKKATKGYRDKKIIGQGVFGTVYRGTLSSKSNKQVVVVKKYNFNAAVTNPSQLVNAVIVAGSSHKNLVRILGCCMVTKMPLMVYEYVTNATSLYEKIHDKMLFSLELRLKIAAEIAGVLAYLHYGRKEEVVHCNVKTANVLLDEMNTAKLSDLGASGWIGALGLPTLVERTLGYLDPEFLHTKSFTEKSDVYSFGVVLVELLTRREAFSFDGPEAERNLASFFVSSLKEDGALARIVDHELVSDGNFETVKKVADVAKRCLRLKGEERPTMQEVAMELQAALRNISTKLLQSRKEEIEGRHELKLPASASSAHIVDVSDEDIRPIGS